MVIGDENCVSSRWDFLSLWIVVRVPTQWRIWHIHTSSERFRETQHNTRKPPEIEDNYSHCTWLEVLLEELCSLPLSRFISFFHRLCLGPLCQSTMNMLMMNCNRDLLNWIHSTYVVQVHISDSQCAAFECVSGLLRLLSADCKT